jgi:hypothetical protein
LGSIFIFLAVLLWGLFCLLFSSSLLRIIISPKGYISFSNIASYG